MSNSTSAVQYAPIVQRLVDLIEKNGWAELFTSAIHKAGTYNIRSLKEIDSLPAYLDWVNNLYHWVPTETHDAKNVYDHLCQFYFILDQPPVKALQNKISPHTTREPLTELSRWIVEFAIAWGEWMDTTSSVTPESIKSFYDAPFFKMNEYMPPPSGYKTFNQLFARHVKPGMRPIAAIGDDRVIVSAADSTIVGTWQISESNDIFVPSTKISVKNLQWSVTELLHGSPYAERFKGGMLMHAFLNVTDYHRLHVPVSGRVLESRVVQRAAYLAVEAQKLDEGGHTIRALRTFDAQDDTGYQFAQTRGILVLDSPVGLVAVLPMGMAQVSSVTMTADVGKKLHKGDEFGYFQFGGSDHVLLFEASVNVNLTAAYNVHYNQGAQIGFANP